MSELKQQLKEMAQLSFLAHRISETQQKNLQMWPFIFFEKVKEVKIDYDLGHGINEATKEINHNSFVNYYLTIDEDANKGIDVNKRSHILEVSVRDLFWKEVKVKVYFNEKLKYESKD